MRIPATPATGSGKVATPPLPGLPQKFQVREQSPTFTATRVVAAGPVRLASGREIFAEVGDYLITQGRALLDAVSEIELKKRYTILGTNDLLLSSALCAQLETTTGVGSTRSPEELLKAVERLARIEIGTVRVDFTPGQLEEVSRRARKRGHTVQQELEAVVERIREAIFWGR